MSTALSRAIENIVDEIPVMINNLIPVLQDVARNVFIPLVVAIVGTALWIRVLQILYRLVVPYKAPELHKQALGCLKKGDDAKSRREAKQMLNLTIRRHPTYLPARLSLIAIQLYQEKDVEEANKTIGKAKENFKDDKELKQMELDAQAMANNLGHMVLAGSFSNTYLGDFGYHRY